MAVDMEQFWKNFNKVANEERAVAHDRAKCAQDNIARSISTREAREIEKERHRRR